MATNRKPGQVFGIDLPDAAVSFDVDQFDNVIRSHGVQFEHWTSMRCPVGLIDEHDFRRPHEDHSGCSNGFLYSKAGNITCLFTGNTMSTQLQEVGAMDGASSTITLPRFYDVQSVEEPMVPCYVSPFDRLYLAEETLLVPDWQVFTSNSTRDKLRFPAVRVVTLVDSLNRSYRQGADFVLQNGDVLWQGSNRPGVDPETGRGRVCSIRFLYRPYFYVAQLIHEIRVSQSENEITGERQVHRMPQSAVIKREYVFLKNEFDELAPDKPRQVLPPDGPRFGPR